MGIEKGAKEVLKALSTRKCARCFGLLTSEAGIAAIKCDVPPGGVPAFFFYSFWAVQAEFLWARERFLETRNSGGTAGGGCSLGRQPGAETTTMEVFLGFTFRPWPLMMVTRPELKACQHGNLLRSQMGDGLRAVQEWSLLGCAGCCRSCEMVLVVTAGGRVVLPFGRCFLRDLVSSVATGEPVFKTQPLCAPKPGHWMGRWHLFGGRSP